MTNILVVDDDRGVAEIVTLTLEAAGYSVTSCFTVGDAEQIVTQQTFDVAVVDVWMKEDNGLDFAAKLEADFPQLPFIIMSGGGAGKSLETVTARADALGAVRMLYKPFDADELLDAVKVALGRPQTI